MRALRSFRSICSSGLWFWVSAISHLPVFRLALLGELTLALDRLHPGDIPADFRKKLGVLELHGGAPEPEAETLLPQFLAYLGRDRARGDDEAFTMGLVIIALAGVGAAIGSMTRQP